MDKVFERKRKEFPKTLDEARKRFGDKQILQKDLRPLVELAKKEGKTIVSTNGTFDVFHEGHNLSLSKAKNYPLENDGIPTENTVLFVFVNTDDSVSRYKKNVSLHHSEKERMEAVAQVTEVDFVAPLKDTTPNNLLELIRTDYHIKGSEYDSKDDELGIPGPIEQEVVEEYGGKMIFIHRPENSVSSGQIRKQNNLENRS